MRTVPSAERREFLRQATARYTAELHQVEAYLAGRGFDLETARRWRLGYVADPMVGHEFARGRLAIPSWTPGGPTGVVFRCTQPHDCKPSGCVKYLAEPGQDRRLFNVHALHIGDSRIVVTEGEFNAMACVSLAGIPAVGIPGGHNWKHRWKWLLNRFSEVIILADDDDAGRKLVQRISSDVPDSRSVLLSEGDANSLIVAHGATYFRSLLEWD